MSLIRCVAILGAALTVACSGGNKGTPDGGTDAGAHVDAGPVDAGPPPCSSDAQCASPQVCDPVELICVAPCLYDDGCGVGRMCITDGGHCGPATACNLSTCSDPCSSSDRNNYCWSKGDACVCQPDARANAGANSGFCERVRPTCSPCTDAGQCSTCPDDASSCDITNFVYPSTCATVGSGTYCLRNVVGGASCPLGFEASAATGLCEPSSGMCGSGSAACTTNDECLAQKGAGYICNVSSGVCQTACQFGYAEGSSQSCPPNDVCDPIPAYLLPDAGIANYGLGHCVAPCDTNGGEDCAAIGAAVGLDMQCVTEKSGEHRCRPVDPEAGATCMNDVECPPTSDGGVYAGYCNLYAFACAYDCRDGVDPVNNTLYSLHDCVPAVGDSNEYSCVADQCIEKNCLQLGGAAFGSPDELCCGEDRDHTGTNDAGIADTSHSANACPAGVDAGQFFIAPAPPWCAPTCSTDALMLPDAGFRSAYQQSIDTCSGDAGFPTFDDSPNICVQYAQSTYACAIAAPYDSECPNGWSRRPTAAGCVADSDCDDGYPDGGVSDGGRCVSQNYPDGGVESQFCSCDSHQPERLDAGAGVLGPYLWGGLECPTASRCFAGPTGGVCALTVACMPTEELCTIGLGP